MLIHGRIMLRSLTFIFLLTLALSPSSFAQGQSTVVPIVYPVFDRTELPCAGIGHFLRKDYASGSFFALSEGLTYYFWRSSIAKKDTNAYPCSSTLTIFYRNGVRGFSPQQFAMLQLGGYSYQTYMNLRFLDAFTTYRNYRASEPHSIVLTDQPILDLSVSPFKWKYLREPEVFLPMLAAAGASLFDERRGPSVFDARTLNWFGLEVSPSEATIGTTLLETFGFTLLAIAEEGFFRGVLQTELSERVNPNFGLVASSLMFGLAHVPLQGWVYSLRATLAGFYLGWQYKKSGYDLGRVITLHFHIDFLPTIISFFRSPLNGRGVYSATCH